MVHTSSEWSQLPVYYKRIIERYQTSYPMKLGLLAKDFGLIVKSATLPANISGEIKEYANGEIIIKINRHDVKARQRYTLAHEIAHFLLHRHLLGNGISDDVLYRSQQSSAVEQEANRLAADILMPAETVIPLYEKYKVDRKDIDIYEAIAGDIGLSTTAVKYRFGK
ncbi:ImmA/IrrE family metallo-endopeptidase [Photobacterium leiognathi]|uniref:ImmA/IrrE family metallo-endopeptidase n=1 Tax=Photobacterium leiognathi TaxID=553611 RepID=UPI001C636B08|nr:ImmA/IrrE family metallo-endopeptidase [Photobacterium leiognathi]